MTKQALRQAFLARRKALSADEVHTYSSQLSERFFDQKWLSALRVIHTFLPISRQKEIDTWPIIHRLWRDFPQVQVLAPVTHASKHRLSHYQLTPDTVLVENRWGIAEPAISGLTPADTREIDLVLVPLLAFDCCGHRVGYGGGFYDRFLAECRLDCLKVGLSLFDPVDLITDIAETDISLHAVLTPTQVYTFD